MDILGAHLYVSQIGLVVYVLLYLPLAWLLFKIVKRVLLKRLPARYHNRSKIVALIAILTLPYWDSLIISVQANYLCARDGGLHIYDTAEVEGFYGASNIEFWAKFGFRYVESYPVRNTGTLRYEINDGEVTSTDVEEIESRYGIFIGKSEPFSRIVRYEDYVQDRTTGRRLGELVTFRIEPGWFDSRVVGISGLTFTPWFCGETHPTIQDRRLSRVDVITKTLLPKSFQGEKRHGYKGPL